MTGQTWLLWESQRVELSFHPPVTLRQDRGFDERYRYPTFRGNAGGGSLRIGRDQGRAVPADRDRCRRRRVDPEDVPAPLRRAPSPPLVADHGRELVAV